MAAEFYTRLKAYYIGVAAALRGEADAAAIFANSTDRGTSREAVYAEFIRQHAPSTCRVNFGGFVFGMDGTESSQLDILVVANTTPRYDFHGKLTNKSFSPVDGTIGVVSVKSMLDKAQLEDSLNGFASIAAYSETVTSVSPIVNKPNLADWPFKIIYSTDGISLTTLLKHLNAFYEARPDIPLGRRPNLIHVAGKYVIARTFKKTILWNPITKQGTPTEEGKFVAATTESDFQGLVIAVDELTKLSITATQLLFDYSHMIHRLYGAPVPAKGGDKTLD